MHPKGCASVLISLVCVLTRAAPRPPAVAQEAASSAQPSPGLVRLFDGRTLDGWVVEHLGASSVVAADDILTITERAGWVRTERTYADFILRFEAKMEPTTSAAVLVLRGRIPTGNTLGAGYLVLASACLPPRTWWCSTRRR